MTPAQEYPRTTPVAITREEARQLRASLYGYVTKRDLSKMGSFLMMGLIGVIIASVVNIFLGSSALQFPSSVSSSSLD